MILLDYLLLLFFSLLNLDDINKWNSNIFDCLKTRFEKAKRLIDIYGVNDFFTSFIDTHANKSSLNNFVATERIRECKI